MVRGLISSQKTGLSLAVFFKRHLTNLFYNGELSGRERRAQITSLMDTPGASLLDTVGMMVSELKIE